MTPRRGRMSDKEKVYFMCVLFPIFWPFIPVLLLCDMGEWIRDVCHARYWRWKHRHDK